jgi:uncharacterized protein YndB with AHSA1/START domain
MATRSVVHDTIVIERDFSASITRVFAAWSRARVRSVWMVPNEGWETVEFNEDFRIGGREVARFGPKGCPHLRSETHYLNIVEERRIVMAGTMFSSDLPISCSMATVELLASQTGTRMIYTEQAAFLDGRDEPSSRRRGWWINLDKLDAHLSTAR